MLIIYFIRNLWLGCSSQKSGRLPENFHRLKFEGFTRCFPASSISTWPRPLVPGQRGHRRQRRARLGEPLRGAGRALQLAPGVHFKGCLRQGPARQRHPLAHVDQGMVQRSSSGLRGYLGVKGKHAQRERERESER